MPRFQWLSMFSRAVFTVCSLVAIALILSAETSLLAADRVEVSAQIVSKEGGQQAELQITARIQPGWHIYSIAQKPGGPKADADQSRSV